MSFTALSISAACCLPHLTSLSVPPLILAMRPLLMFRFPIILGSSLVESGLLLCGTGLGVAVAALLVTVLGDFCGSFCGCCGPALAAIHVVQRLVARTVAVIAREKRLFISNLQRINDRGRKTKEGLEFCLLVRSRLRSATNVFQIRGLRLSYQAIESYSISGAQ